MHRRELFGLVRRAAGQKGDVHAVHPLLRPPYGRDESLFQSGCSVCESKACVTSCDEKIIVLDAAGVPTLDFSASGCTFCESCADVCESDVLSLAHLAYKDKINASFRIDTQTCIAHDGVICFACKEPCIEDAILFNGLFNPVIDTQRCTGCGFCMGRCPTEAISYDIVEMKEQKEQTA